MNAETYPADHGEGHTGALAHIARQVHKIEHQQCIDLEGLLTFGCEPRRWVKFSQARRRAPRMFVPFSGPATQLGEI